MTERINKIKNCRYCLSELHLNSSFCTVCNHWQDYQRFTRFLFPVLSAITAALAVAVSAGYWPEKKTEINPPKVYVKFSNLELGIEDGFRSISLIIVNDEADTILVKNEIECQVRQQGISALSIKLFVDARQVSEYPAELHDDFFIVKKESVLKPYYLEKIINNFSDSNYLKEHEEYDVFCLFTYELNGNLVTYGIITKARAFNYKMGVSESLKVD